MCCTCSRSCWKPDKSEVRSFDTFVFKEARVYLHTCTLNTNFLLSIQSGNFISTLAFFTEELSHDSEPAKTSSSFSWKSDLFNSWTRRFLVFKDEDHVQVTNSDFWFLRLSFRSVAWCFIADSLCSLRESWAWGTFLAAEPPCELSGEAARENPASRTSYEFWMPPTFVTLFGTIWLSNHEELCNTKLTCKWVRPSVTIKSRTKQLFVESYPGSRQDILKLLQTWETKSFIKRSFSRNKKIFMLQKRSKNSLKCFRGQILPETKTTGNQCWKAQETHRSHDLSMGKDNICSV